MVEYQFAAESFPIWKAILWCFYPFSVVVLVELFFRIINNDDDDDDQGGGIGVKVSEPQLVPLPQGT